MGLCYVHLFLWRSCSRDFWKTFGINAGHDRRLPKLESGSKYLPAITLCHMLYSHSWPAKESARVLNICRHSIKMSAPDIHQVWLLPASHLAQASFKTLRKKKNKMKKKKKNELAHGGSHHAHMYACWLILLPKWKHKRSCGFHFVCYSLGYINAKKK